VFLGLTADDSTAIRRRIAFKALLITFVVIVAFILLGKVIFSLFGITLPAFQITGGILVFMIGLQMLHGQPSQVHSPVATGKQENLQGALSVAVTPLAMPILGGPGTIAAAMNFSSGGGMTGMVITIVAFGLLCLLTYVFFVSGERLVRVLGDEGLMMVTRLMGLILAVIGTQMFITGVAGAIKASG
ncbi:MAG: MarC family protein, partial [Gammaproteobacteria bacterium]|nr:MarC family protein [Gammaproteobacteria bacterium]